MTTVDGRFQVTLTDLIATGALISEEIEQAFVADLLDLLGDVRALHVFKATGTNLSGRGKDQFLVTWDGGDISGFDVPPGRLGAGLQIILNGVGEGGGGAPISFGDGKRDQPFSVFALINLVDPNAVVVAPVINVWGPVVAAREWFFELDGNENPVFRLTDGVTNDSIAQRDTAHANDFPRGVWVLLIGAYDGFRSSSGIRLYYDGVRAEDSAGDIGSYVSMKVHAQTVLSLASRTTHAPFEGSIALSGIVGKEISDDEAWVLKELVNGYFGLNL